MTEKQPKAEKVLASIYRVYCPDCKRPIVAMYERQLWSLLDSHRTGCPVRKERATQGGNDFLGDGRVEHERKTD